MKDFPQNNYYSRSGSIVSPPYPPLISVVSSFLLSSSPGLSSLLPLLRAEKTQRKYGRNAEMINRFHEATSQFPLPYSCFKKHIIFVPVLITKKIPCKTRIFKARKLLSGLIPFLARPLIEVI